MRAHLGRWGAVWILTAFFALSWAGQAFFQVAVEGESWGAFWASTMENWQSEWLQLIWQSILVLALQQRLFRASQDADKEDVGDIKKGLAEIVYRLDQAQLREGQASSASRDS